MKLKRHDIATALLMIIAAIALTTHIKCNQ